VYDAIVPISLRRVLVTGASGFLGGHVARTLAAQQVAVRAHGRDAARLSFGAGIDVCRCALADVSALTEAARGCDAVVHAAALSSPWGRRQDFFDANVTGTANIIAAARRAGVRRLVHISSPAVIFDGRDQHLLTDAAAEAPRHTSEYGRTKAIAERLVRAASDDLEMVILRPKAIYGAGDRALVPRLLRAAQRGSLPQIGDGSNRVDVTHVDDVVQAILCALTTDRAVGETFMITGDEHVLLWPMLRTLIEGVGLPAPRRTIPLRVALLAAGAMEAAAALTRREPTLTRYSALILGRTQTYDITKARALLGYAPRVSSSDGLTRTIDAIRRDMAVA
jgi:nucleoside-diphosphate-sugar epimerase